MPTQLLAQLLTQTSIRMLIPIRTPPAGTAVLRINAGEIAVDQDAEGALTQRVLLPIILKQSP